MVKWHIKSNKRGSQLRLQGGHEVVVFFFCVQFSLSILGLEGIPQYFGAETREMGCQRTQGE